MTAADERLATIAFDSAALAAALGAQLAPTWPPQFWDESLEFSQRRLTEDSASTGWWVWYWVLKSDASGGPHLLIGDGGFKGPPSANGDVEVGYGVCEAFQRRGLATEAMHAMCAWAFADRRVQRVHARTLPGLVASIGVMTNLGMVRREDLDSDGEIAYCVERVSSR